MRKVNFALISAGVCMVTLVTGCMMTGEPITANNLKVEYLTNPLGLDVMEPRFSWVLESPERGITQSAYQIIVSQDEDSAENGIGDMWDTGSVHSDQSVGIVYEGKTLESGKQYFWRVKVWEAREGRSSWSDVQTFQMGLLGEDAWKSEWIASPDTTISAPLFRKEFEVNSGIQSAFLYVTTPGYYELYLNGQKVGDHVLDPGLTNNRKRVLYETYDVKDLLQQGPNALGMILGNGSYRVVKTEGRWSWHSTDHSFGTPPGRVQLHVVYENGAEELVVSDGSWKSSQSPITYNHIYGGEDYDARLEQEGWNEAGFDDSAWQLAEVVEIPDLVLDSQVMPPIRVTETLQPVVKTRPEPDTYLFDLGQNIPGWWRIRVKGAAGTEIRIRGAETLNDSLFSTPLKEGDRISTKFAYHKDVWTTYILKGDQVEVYEPRFFYTGFRYIEAKVSPADQLEFIEVEGRVVHSDLERNGHFASSDTLLNRIYQATIWAQRGNLHSIPTDCPHREKGGYLGDGQVIAEASMHDFRHMRPFYEKWLNDMKDEQQENGRIPNTAPTLIGGMGGGVPWGSAHILIPWWMYQFYEDTSILEENYESMKFYLDFLHDLARNDSEPAERYVINDFGTYWYSLGEWCAPGETRDGPNHPVASTYYWYLSSKTFSDIASVLGRTEDQVRYRALADSILGAFNEKFFDPETNLYGWDKPFQTYLLFALHQDMVPEGHKDDVMKRLIDDIMITREGHLGTGILGTKHLFPVLAHAGREDVIHTVVTKKTFPSYGYWIENGATTLLEHWGGESSHNHQMFGSVNEYFYKYLAGIRSPMDDGVPVGYREIHIKPYVPEGLEWVEASVETIRGKVTSRWEQREDGVELTVTVPAGTTGKISVPTRGFGSVAVTESGNPVWNEGNFVAGVEGVTGGVMEDGFATFDVGSGTYRFDVAWN